jgi:hypothetical protein
MRPFFLMTLKKCWGALLSGNRKPFESKIDFKKILAKRCTETVSFEFPGRVTKAKKSALLQIFLHFVTGGAMFCYETKQASRGRGNSDIDI